MRPKASDQEKKSYHHGDLRSALMSAALTLIERDGVKAFNLKDAARMAGVSIAAPYRHFADKDALLYAVQATGFDLFNAALQAAYDAAESFQDKALELGVAYLRFAMRHPAYFRVMFTSVAAGPPIEKHHGADGFSLLMQSVANLMPDASEQLRIDVVLANWSIVHGFAMLELDGAFRSTIGANEPEGQLRRILSLMVRRDEAD